MRQIRFRRLLLPALAAAAALFVGVAPAAGQEEPLFIFTPMPPAEGGPFEQPKPPPVSRLNGPCGVAVDSKNNFYVSDYYHNNVDVWGPENLFNNYYYGEGERQPSGGMGFQGVLQGVDPIDGPCGLALD